MEKERICIIEPLEQDPNTVSAARKFRLPIVFSSCGSEYLEDTYTTYFVIKDFDGPVFAQLSDKKARILGPTILINLSITDGKLCDLELRRPLYNQSMRSAVVCFTGYRNHCDELSRISRMIYHMGGRIRREMCPGTTHLVAHHPGGKKYEYADTFQVPILAGSWVLSSWEHRDEPNFSALHSTMVMQHKLKLGGTKICFLGFSPEWTATYKDFVLKNNGFVADLNDPDCTHLVVNTDPLPEIPECLPSGCCVVKSEWFWKSMETEICPDIKDYIIQSSCVTPDTGNLTTPGSAASRARKRKRLQQLARCSGSPVAGPCKRRSSANTLDFSGNILDWTLTPDKDGQDSGKDPKSVSARKLKFLELVNTESNYVDILKVLVLSFKAPLDEAWENGNPIVDGMELKMIFGNLPPILDAHSSMLEDLKVGVQTWNSTFSIGQIILNKAKDLQKAYPPFINCFEQSKETLNQCEASNPRFHAFLKIRQALPECGRQTLKELMIRPVQRLPSMSLLLGDLLKHTEKDHPDYNSLELALAAIKEVMTHINEDKRRTEDQVKTLALFNDIENFPPNLIAHHRSLIEKFECIDLADGRKGDAVILFLFTDTLEICYKRRPKGFATLRGTRSLQKLQRTKSFKHHKYLSLCNIRRIVNIRDSEDYSFSILAFSTESHQETILSFAFNDQATKSTFLETLCKQLAYVLCLTDPDLFLEEMDKSELSPEQSIKASSSHSLTKALKFASNAKVKMGRALSLSRTPSRASRILCRRGAAPGASPAVHQLAQMRLQSCANLNDSCSSLDSALHVW